MRKDCTAIESIDDVLEGQPSEIQEWLRQVQQGQVNAPGLFNWLGLAESTALKAREKERAGSPSQGLAWAQVAISVYEWMATELYLLEEQSSQKESCLISAMVLRTYMICRLGASPGDFVLDVRQIVDWLFEGLKISYENAERQ